MPNLRGARLTTTRSTSSNHGRSSLRPLPCLLSELSSSHRCLDASGDSHRAMPPPSSPCPRSTLPDDFDLRLASAATPPPASHRPLGHRGPRLASRAGPAAASMI